ncbi:GNAT family N-acetyltransferase [Polyangium sp. 15x6]|uniref:GNAT family N-acetyltransferase n=1 Tax=Polyangium sp. 15x6 TaxID=3042687 RepID=UPI00249AF1BB|nr:GNAT family N-acetyltransferase [Polyangium sp. 15x6]MDI3282016.1 GNAT family N-acetyltransferase [Polyangium sp. 15x6]
MFELRVHETIRNIPEEAWDGLGGVSEAPFLRWAFFDVLERTGCVEPTSGWLPHYLTLHEGERLIAAAPTFLKGNSEGEFVFDHAWASAAHRAGIEYFPKLVVAVPFTPATAPRILLAEGASSSKIAAAMAEGLRQLVARLEISSAHVLFPTAEEATKLASFGLAERYGLQFHWKNPGYATYDDFLARFSSKRRNQWKRERREMAAQGIEIVTLRGREITPDLVDAMYGYYTATVDKFYWGRRYLNRAFFEEIVPRLGDGVEVVLARDGKRPIAGAFNFAGKEALYGRYWGASEERPFLHFNVCFYHSIEQCILRKIARFEPGAGGEHKMTRGFEPTITRSLHHVADPRLDAAIRDYLARERQALAREASNPEIAFR